MLKNKYFHKVNSWDWGCCVSNLFGNLFLRDRGAWRRGGCENLFHFCDGFQSSPTGESHWSAQKRIHVGSSCIVKPPVVFWHLWGWEPLVGPNLCLSYPWCLFAPISNSSPHPLCLFPFHWSSELVSGCPLSWLWSTIRQSDSLKPPWCSG